jgi:hypothetical protein
MKKDPKDGGYYQRSVKDVKAAAKVIARKAEKQYGLPSGTVRICLTKMTSTTREKIVAKYL